MAASLADAQYIFHVAGLTRGCTSAEYMAANAEATARLIDAAICNAEGGRGKAEVIPVLQRFVYVSSLAAAGPSPSQTPLDENSEPRPAMIMAAANWRPSESSWRRRTGSRSPSSVRRPSMGRGTRIFCRCSGRPGGWAWCRPSAGGTSSFRWCMWRTWPGGSGWRHRVSAATGQTYFVAGGTHTMGEFVAALGAALGRRLRLLPVPRPLAWLAGEFGQLKWALTGKPQIMSRRKIRDLLQPRWTCSWEKARRELGYQEQIGLEVGLTGTIDWYVREKLLPKPKSRS